MSGTHCAFATYLVKAGAKHQPRGPRGLTEAGLVALGEARGTAAGEGTDGVDAEELAVVLPGGALVHVCSTEGPRGLRAGPARTAGFPGETPWRRLPTPCSGSV